MKRYDRGEDDKTALEGTFGKPLETLNSEVMDYVRQWAERIRVAAPLSDERVNVLEVRASTGGLMSADDWAALASARMAQRNVEGGRDAAQRATELDPRTARAWALLGYIAHKVDHNDEKAIDLLKRATAADADYAMAYAFLGDIFKERGRTDEAIAAFEKLRQLYPRMQQPEYSPHHNLADLYEKKDQPAQAIEVLRELTEVNNVDKKGFLRLAELLFEQKQYAEAAQAYEGAFSIDPFDTDAHLSAALSFERARNDDAAHREYRIAAVTGDYRNMRALIGWARTAARSNDRDSAKKALTHIYQIDPDNPEAAGIEMMMP
jgi:tetratricopeptide (TPR) repeat protein